MMRSASLIAPRRISSATEMPAKRAEVRTWARSVDGIRSLKDSLWLMGSVSTLDGFPSICQYTVNAFSGGGVESRVDGVGSRLARALSERHMTLHALHLVLQEKQVAGSSYANMRQIRDGKTEPSRGFLVAAAAELSVAVGWLAFGVGSMTASDAVADGAAALYPAERHAALQARFGTLLTNAPSAERVTAVVSAFVDEFSPGADARIWHSVARPWLVLAHRLGGGSKGDIRAARTLARSLLAPLGPLRVDPSQMAPWQLAHYATLVAAAVDVALAEPSMLKPTTRPANDKEA